MQIYIHTGIQKKNKDTNKTVTGYEWFNKIIHHRFNELESWPGLPELIPVQLKKYKTIKV